MMRRWLSLFFIAWLVSGAGSAAAEEGRDGGVLLGGGDAGLDADAGDADQGADAGDGLSRRDRSSAMSAMMGGGAGPTKAMAGHILVEATERSVRVSEVYVVAFGADIEQERGDGPWLRLPDEASSITVDRGEELLRLEGNELRLTDDVEPGRQAFAFSFVVPAEQGRAVITHELPFFVGALHVMWPASAPFSARAMGFDDRGVIEMGPRRMRILERASLPEGERLVIITSDDPSPAPASSSREPETLDPLGQLPWLTLLASIVALLISATVPLRRRARGPDG